MYHSANKLEFVSRFVIIYLSFLFDPSINFLFYSLFTIYSFDTHSNSISKLGAFNKYEFYDIQNDNEIEIGFFSGILVVYA